MGTVLISHHNLLRVHAFINMLIWTKNLGTHNLAHALHYNKPRAPDRSWSYAFIVMKDVFVNYKFIGANILW